MIGAKVTHNAPETGLLKYWLSRLLMTLMGWKVTGEFPVDRKFVLIGAPHTSNWDFVLGLSLTFIFRVKPQWLGKDALFNGVLGVLMRALGGIAIDRSNANGVVGQMVEQLKQADQLVIMLAPSGTRKKMQHWKSGFYHIAHQANVPIVCGYLDFKTKEANIGLAFVPTGNVEQDMNRIREYYKNVSAKYPEQTTPVKLAEEIV